MNDPIDAEDAERLGAALVQAFPEARCELYVRDPWDLLVAAILSARTSDAQVNRVMAVLCEHFCGPEAFAALDHRDLAKVLNRLPLYPQKARAIVECARHIVDRYHGTVPQSMQELSALPGVGRKTAAVVLGNAFGIPAIAADGHVQRIVRRLGWCERENPREAERALAQRFPPHHWVSLCHRLIRLGREHCRPLQPRCSSCPCAATCPRQGVASSR